MSEPKPMTSERLAEIEARVAEAVQRWNSGDVRAAWDVTRDDVPALIAEVRRLRGLLGLETKAEVAP